MIADLNAPSSSVLRLASSCGMGLISVLCNRLAFLGLGCGGRTGDAPRPASTHKRRLQGLCNLGL